MKEPKALRSHTPPVADDASQHAMVVDLAPILPIEHKLRELSSGPRVDNEPVWQFLDHCEQMEELARKEQRGTEGGNDKNVPLFGLGLDRGRAVPHLGSFLYDGTRKSAIPTEMLINNVGATVEVRISGRMIGLGITEAEWRSEEARLEAEVIERIERDADQGITPTLALDRATTSIPASDEYFGRWRLGWRGLEHARINREIRLTHAWHERRAQESIRNKRLRRSVPTRAPPRSSPFPVRAIDDAELQRAGWQFWAQPSLEHRKLWGTDVYTDDSDVLAMCVHAGWIEAPHIPGVPEWLCGGGCLPVAKAWKALSVKEAEQTGEPMPEPTPREPIHIVPSATCDLSVILRIAPKLVLYKGCHRGGIKSRSWGNTHDGVSLVVESVELRPPNYATGCGRRSAKTRISHMAKLRQTASQVPPSRSLPLTAQVCTDSHGISLSSLVPSDSRVFWDTHL